MKKWDIDTSFGRYAKFRPPFNRAVFLLARLALSLMPKGMPGKGVRVKKYFVPAGAGKRTVRVYEVEPSAAAENAPCLLYFHGGGFVFKAARHHFLNAAEYARRTGCRVLLVDYRLAPAHPYPAAHEDCYAAYRHIARQAAERGAPLALGGDSAGGCLAADTVFYAAQEGLPLPVIAMLLYPVLDRRMDTPSMRAFPDTPMWNARLNRRMWQTYLRGQNIRSPAEREDFCAFPPVYLETAEFDCLRGEGLAFAAALREQGVPVSLFETRGTMHGYDVVRRSPLVSKSLLARCEALRAAFDQSLRKGG